MRSSSVSWSDEWKPHQATRFSSKSSGVHGRSLSVIKNNIMLTYCTAAPSQTCFTLQENPRENTTCLKHLRLCATWALLEIACPALIGHLSQAEIHLAKPPGPRACPPAYLQRRTTSTYTREDCDFMMREPSFPIRCHRPVTCDLERTSSDEPLGKLMMALCGRRASGLESDLTHGTALSVLSLARAMYPMNPL